MARSALEGVREVEWSSKRMPRDIFYEEYQDFIRMGLSRQEIARAFACTMDALEHRLKRYGLMP